MSQQCISGVLISIIEIDILGSRTINRWIRHFPLNLFYLPAKFPERNTSLNLSTTMFHKATLVVLRVGSPEKLRQHKPMMVD